VSIGISTTVKNAFDDALFRTRAALAQQGFGVLTEIDVTPAFKDKLPRIQPPPPLHCSN